MSSCKMPPPRSRRKFTRSTRSSVITSSEDLMGRQDKDDPPIVFDWIDKGLAEFWQKAVAYGATVGAVDPPDEINGGAHLQGAVTPASMIRLKGWILSFVYHRNDIHWIGGPRNRLGFHCHPTQFADAILFLRTMAATDPWFYGVLWQPGQPQPRPIATLMQPSHYSRTPANLFRSMGMGRRSGRRRPEAGRGLFHFPFVCPHTRVGKHFQCTKQPNRIAKSPGKV
jgi:hypothetical protein